MKKSTFYFCLSAFCFLFTVAVMYSASYAVFTIPTDHWAHPPTLLLSLALLMAGGTGCAFSLDHGCVLLRKEPKK